MKIISSVKEMQRYAEMHRMQGQRIGVVPTMGFLHDGHCELIRVAKNNSGLVITTSFVNPAQFGPAEDFNEYPRDVERDKHLAESAGSDVLFTPSREEMYPAGYLAYVEVEKITNVLEGKIRPSHFKGVATIVAKLFNVTMPQVAVFGQKDAQQAIVIKRMVSDLNFNVDIIIVPIVREPDGLAMSSRNVYLSVAERKVSPVLFQSLQLAKLLIERGERECSIVISEMTELIASKPITKIDYISIANADTLEELTALSEGNRVLISLAIRIGTIRLIDNILLTI